MQIGKQPASGSRSKQRFQPSAASFHRRRVFGFRRPLIAARACKGQSEADRNHDSNASGSIESTRSGFTDETAALKTSSGPQQTAPSEAPAAPPLQQFTREIDVNRAVRLLKLTSQRTNSNTCKLPSWLARIQDSGVRNSAAQPTAPNLDRFVANNDTVNGSTSSQRNSEDAADLDSTSPLDSYMAFQDPNNTVVAHQQSSSRNSSALDSTAATPNGYNGRVISASDPVVVSSSSSSRKRQFSSPGGFSMLLGVEDTDAAKEQERQYRRAVFSFDRWAAHRSTARYIRHFRGMFSSRTFQGLLQPMSFLTGMALLCGLYNVYAVPKGAPRIVISSTPLDITAFAVSLLLVFRTDSSYARWEEALKTWNEVRSLSKDLARQSCYWVNEPAPKAMMVRWSEAFSRALLVHCRVDGSLEHELEDVLLPHEVAAVAAVGPSGAPSFVLQVLAELIEQCFVTETKEDTMFSTVRSLGDSVAVCNKLLRYPLPLAYTRHTSRFMFLWLSAMPWAMWGDMHWVCVPITAAISYLLLGIDEIGVQIEEPFGILPLEDVCVDITAEIDAMMERQDIVTDLLAAGGVHCVPRSMCGECGQPVTAAIPQYAAAGAGGGGGSSSSSSGASHLSSSNGSAPASHNGLQVTARSDASAAAARPDSSSSSVMVSSSASNGAGGISRIKKTGSPQGLVARWVSSTISGSYESDADPLSSLEDAVAPGFDLRGFVVSDLEAGEQQQQHQEQRPGRGWNETSSLESVDSDVSSSGSNRSSSRLGWYERQPAPNFDHRYPD